MLKVSGIAASKGIAVAQALKLVKTKLDVSKKAIRSGDKEIARLKEAFSQSKQELAAIKKKTFQELGKDKAEIFAAHILVLEDPEFLTPIEDKIKLELVNAEYALDQVATEYVKIFENMENEYLRERAADIKDVTKRVLSHLLKVKELDLTAIDRPVILFAEDLTPSDTAQLNRQFVKGFVTSIGGRTSHSAIMARSLEIPAVVGVAGVVNKVKENQVIILDGIEGDVIFEPDKDTKTEYEKKKKDYEAWKADLQKLLHSPSITKDKKRVELGANIGTPYDVEAVLSNGGEAVGLYRTEFLYMGRDNFPTEEEQFEAYKNVLEKMKDRPVIVRTLDIGGDKELSYLDLPKEMNPFLGFRAIRLCLKKQDLFRTQLRALLRASVYGKLKIMFPMIATIDEFRQAKKILLNEKDKLGKEKISVSEQIEIGMMVEIPSSAVLAQQFAKEVDFFSIGTNDLIQYTMAADRMNQQVSYLYQPFNPAILHLIKNVIDASHAEGKWTGMCGEMAGEQKAIPLLLGLGLDEFSMSASSILPARSLISKLSSKKMKDLSERALACCNTEEVLALLEKELPDLI